jgi:hypothetical protein
MNQILYWQIVEDAHAHGDAAYEELKRQLEDLSLEDLLEFEAISYDLSDPIETAPHLLAAYLINEGVVSGDDFLEHMEAIAYAPQEVYLAVKDDPDRLLDFPVFRRYLGLDRHPFAYAPLNVGEAKFGEAFDQERDKPRWKGSCKPLNFDSIEFEGQRGYQVLTRENAQRLVPRLYKRYGQEPDFRW